MEESHHHGTDSKPAKKFIQIDSIFIDLFSSDDKCDDQKCEVFSIRGYVSDMRKNDWKRCWPFPDIADGHNLDENIRSVPPVYERSSDRQRGKRHWQESSDKAADQGIIFDSCRSFEKLSGTSPRAPKQDVINGRTMADNASTSSFQPSSSDQKEKKLEVAEIEPVSEESLAALGDGKEAPADHLNGQLNLVISENDGTVDVDRELYPVKLQENGVTSMESYQNIVSSSESAETVGNRPHYRHLGTLHRRRAPKIRLLTELLGENGNMKAKHVESSPSNGTPKASVQADVRYASKCQVTIEESLWHSDHKRARRLPRSRKFRHQEVPSSSSVDKQIQTWRGELESSVSSLGTKNALKTMKSPWSSYKMDGNNGSIRKKKSKFPVVDPYSMSLAHYNEFPSRTSPSISLNAVESKCSTPKNPNSSKESMIFEDPTNVFPWNNETTRTGSVTQIDVETMKSRTEANPFQYANYKNNEKELLLSHNNYSNPQRSHEGTRQNELPTLFPEQDDASRDAYRRGNGKRTIEAQEPLALKKRLNQRVEQASDRGNSDDIPMEIVELMAKNQYERRLPDAENTKQVSETGNFSRAVQVSSYGDIYRNGKELLQNAQARKQKSPDYFSNIGEYHFNTNCPQHDHMFGHYVSVHSQEEPSNGYGMQYSFIGSKRKGCNEIRKCNGTIVESGPYSSQVQPSEGFIHHLPVSGQNIEAAYTWSSSSRPVHRSDGYRRFPAHLADSKRISSPRSLQMGSANAQNYHNHHSTCLERHGRENNSEAYSQKFAESSFFRRPNVVELHRNPVGSLELYSNETISAMHLLSLMDARTQSNAPMTAGETHNSFKKPPVPRPRKRKEFSAMDICFNETIQQINQFSSAFHDEVCISATNASASTFQHSTGIGSDTNFSGRAVFKSRNGVKMKCSDPSAWSNDPKQSRSPFRSGDLSTGDKTFPVNGIQKGAVNASTNTEECKLVALTRTLKNKKSTSEAETCRVNKNPADFSCPEAGNIYMIGAEDFSFGRTILSKNRSSSIYSGDRYERPKIV